MDDDFKKRLFRMLKEFYHDKKQIEITMIYEEILDYCMQYDSNAGDDDIYNYFLSYINCEDMTERYNQVKAEVKSNDNVGVDYDATDNPDMNIFNLLFDEDFMSGAMDMLEALEKEEAKNDN